MPSPLYLLLTLTLFLLTPATAFTWAQFKHTPIDGSISGPHDGDWLQDTRCTCASDNTSTAVKRGTITQWEYYNFHNNRTYLEATARDLSNIYGGQCFEQTYPAPWPKTGHFDRLMFCPNEFVDTRRRSTDYIHWNDQMRALGKTGSQGYFANQEWWVAEVVCPDICSEFMGKLMSAFETVPMRGTREIYDDMDDMCDHCK